MISDNSTSSFALGALLFAPIGFLFGILGFREYERYREEKEMESRLMDAAPGPTIPSDEPPMPPSAFDSESNTAHCEMCGAENEVPPGAASFECVDCNTINHL